MLGYAWYGCLDAWYDMNVKLRETAVSISNTNTAGFQTAALSGQFRESQFVYFVITQFEADYQQITMVLLEFVWSSVYFENSLKVVMKKFENEV